jgi:WhiB family redox-sensing transcriptional regulator
VTDPDLSWRDYANCLGIDPDVFYPERRDPRLIGRHVAAAKTICHSCTVQAECREYAIAHERWGIWGATTPTERRHIRIARRHAQRLKATA